MKLISHRGNLLGSNPLLENNPTYILYAINKGFDVEIDLHYLNNIFYLGHDYPKIDISWDFLKRNKSKLWCHAKTIQTLRELLNRNMHTFFHDKDKVTLTSKGIIWTFPGEEDTNKSVIVNNEPKIKKYSSDIYGICSDYIKLWETNDN